MKRKGKAIALSTVALGLVVLSAAGFTGREWIVETYQIHRLCSSDEQSRLEAADALANARSERAVKYLIDVLQKEPREKIRHLGLSIGGLSTVRDAALTPLAYALYRIGDVALPSLREAAGVEEQRMLELGVRHPGILNQISKLIECPERTVQLDLYDSPIEKR